MPPSCPVCGKLNNSETGVQFPTESTKFLRYCLALKLDPKKADKKSFICFDHFSKKDLIRSSQGDKIVGVGNMAVPTKIAARPSPAVPSNQSSSPRGMNQTTSSSGSNARMTLDQLLAKNVGLPTVSTAISSSHSTSPAASTIMNFQTPSTSHSHASPEIGIFGFPRSQQHNQSVIQTPSSSWHTPQSADRHLVDIAKRTLVIYWKKDDHNQKIDLNSVIKEWMQNFFGLPSSAIQHISDTQNIANFQTIFLVLDNMKTVETILAMYSATPQSNSPYILNSALDVLRDGGAVLLRSAPAHDPATKQPDVAESLRLLLQNPSSMACNNAQFSDESVWRNLAAAMVPAYNSLLAAATHHQQHPSLANAPSVSSPSNSHLYTQEIPSSTIQAIMQQIESITRQNPYPS